MTTKTIGSLHGRTGQPKLLATGKRAAPKSENVVVILSKEAQFRIRVRVWCRPDGTPDEDEAYKKAKEALAWKKGRDNDYLLGLKPTFGDSYLNTAVILRDK